MKQKQMTNQYKDVDERFDKEFTCIVTYEKWPDEEEQRLREPQYKFKDFPNTNPKIIKNFLHSELEKVRQETIDSCIEALPKKKIEKDVNGIFEHTRYKERIYFNGFNQALDQSLSSLQLLKNKK